MLEKYGLQSSVASGNYNIAREPLYFVRSGMVNLLNGHLVYFGNRGYGWSSITRVYSSLTTANAYGLDFYTSGIRPSYDQNYRFRGLPVRCLVY